MEKRKNWTETEDSGVHEGEDYDAELGGQDRPDREYWKEKEEKLSEIFTSLKEIFARNKRTYF